jgi:hypothetical protein
MFGIARQGIPLRHFQRPHQAAGRHCCDVVKRVGLSQGGGGGDDGKQLAVAGCQARGIGTVPPGRFAGRSGRARDFTNIVTPACSGL